MPDMTKGHVWHARATSSASGYGDPRALVYPLQGRGYCIQQLLGGTPFRAPKRGPESGQGMPATMVTGAC